MLAVVAALGWVTVLVLTVIMRRHRCPIEQPSRAVLVNHAGLPESIRTLRMAPPKEYTRPHGKQPPTIYTRIGSAVVYQATAPRQPQ
jgi:hypothetical protein